MIEGCPTPREDCPFFNMKPKRSLKKQTTNGCHSDDHHLYYPARDYTTPLEKEFRQLPENRQQTCRWEHELIHLEDPAPRKPKAEQMIQALSQIAIQNET